MCSTQVLYKSSLTLRHRSAHEKNAVTTDSSEAPANSSRVVFPNTHDRPDLHSPIVFLRRHAILFVLYFIWIILIGTYVTLWMISAACIARSIVSLGAVPVPLAVQLYLAGMVAYFVFRRVRFGNKTQGDWPAVRAWCRRNAIDYSYFRHHICVFEDREEESLQEPEKPMVPANDKALFAYHPHGVLSSGWALNGSHSMRFKESDARWLVADNIFWFPFAGDVLHWLAYDGANKKNFVHHLKNDRNVCLLPGGFEEATIYQRGKHRVYIKKRAGFIKLALQFGYKVHPVYTFGEEQLFNTLTGFLKQRLMMNAWKMPGVVFFGRLLCFFMPFEDVELTTVVGSPIQLPKIENPTDEEVAKYHGMYIDALAALYERHKHKYAVDPSLPLEIF